MRGSRPSGSNRSAVRMSSEMPPISVGSEPGLHINKEKYQRPHSERLLHRGQILPLDMKHLHGSVYSRFITKASSSSTAKLPAPGGSSGRLSGLQR